MSNDGHLIVKKGIQLTTPDQWEWFVSVVAVASNDSVELVGNQLFEIEIS